MNSSNCWRTQGDPHLTRASAPPKINRYISSESVFIQHNYLEIIVTKPGNPGWSSGKPMAVPASAPTEFERQAKRLGLSEDGYATSDQLRRWCEHNRDRCYIPEWLLKRWGMPVDPNVT